MEIMGYFLVWNLFGVIPLLPLIFGGGLALVNPAFIYKHCKVNWFGDTLDVPWYYVVVPVFLIFLLAYINLMSKTYVCPHCKAEFKVKPYQLSVTVHSFGKRLAKCPNCGTRGFCYVKK